MDELFLKCPYCESGRIVIEKDGAQRCEQCEHEYDVKKLVLVGDDFEAADGHFISALRVAVRHGWHDEIGALVDSGYDINRRDYDGKTSLKYAVDHVGLDNQEIYVNTSLLLITKGADVNICDMQLLCPLHSAVRFACIPLVKSLLDYDADANAIGHDGMTPLHFCGEPADFLMNELNEGELDIEDNLFWNHFVEKQVEIAIMLLAKGADPNLKQTLGWTPLSRIAVLGGNQEIVKLLIGHGADKNHRSDTGFSPLGYARLKEDVSPRHAILAKTLVELGATDARPGLCFVATAVYGSHNSEPVQVLRSFRDRKMNTHALGKWLIRAYDFYGPKASQYVVRSPLLKKTIRALLDVFVTVIREDNR